MTLIWNADRSTFFYDAALPANDGLTRCSAETTWLGHTSRIHSLISTVSRAQRQCLAGNGDVAKLEMDLHELILIISAAFDSAKTTSVVCLMGVGLGVGLTAYIIYRISHKVKKKPPDENDGTDSDRKERYLYTGLNSLTMGNRESFQLSAGIQLDHCASPSTDSNRVRHRSVPRANLCASIVEDESGAYISRTAFNGTVGATSAPMSETAFSITAADGSVSEQSAMWPGVKLLANEQSPAMSDSGYLEAAEQKSSDVTSAVHSISVSAKEEAASSEVSSLSDQQMHDLGIDGAFSDLSSCGGSLPYQQDEVEDEDVLCVQIGEDEEPEGSKTIQELLSSMLADENRTLCHSSTDTIITTDGDSFPSTTEGRNSSMENHSSFSTPSPILALKREDEGSRPSSVFSSPLFGAVSVSGHSRSSSITSADIDLEATLLEDTENEELRSMEVELEEISEEIRQVEERLNDLMSVDTTQLYFNVDGMKKLTEVVLNSDDINLTSSEIAKAFQILRKYRYTFTSPARKPTIGHNEAESTNVSLAPKKSLPYLDLADGCTSQLRCINAVHQDSSTSDIITECDADEYRSRHPCSDFSKIVEERGYRRVYKVETEDHTPLVATYVAKIMNGAADPNDISIDSLLKRLDDVYISHSFLQDWNFSPVISQLPADKLSVMKLCVKTSIQQIVKLGSIESIEERAAMVMHMFNNATNSRALIIEGIRLQMFLRVHDLYHHYVSGMELPVYGWLLFNRATSSSPRSYFVNHLQTHSSASFKPVDLSLLADTLNVRMTVFHPLDTNSNNLKEEYPENDVADRPHISLAYHQAISYAVLL